MAKQPSATRAPGAQPARPPAAAAPERAPHVTPPHERVLHVLDLTARITEENKTGERVHDMIVDGVVKHFTFKPSQPLALPAAVALKFLAKGFQLTDADGNRLEYRRRPKQPDELQAGEKLTLADDQTIANYDELSTAALQQRVLEMPNSDQFAANPSRAAMIRFLVEHRVKTREENTSKESDTGADAFEPQPEADDDELAA